MNSIKNKKELLLATIASGLGMWLLAGFYHEVLAAAFYAAETGAKHEGTGIILVAYLVLSLIMAYLYPQVYRGGRAVTEGLKFGILIGVLWVFPHEFAMAGAHGESLVYVFKNAAWHIVEQGIGGVIIALVYQRLRVTIENPSDEAIGIAS